MQETKGEATLRQFALNCKRQQINLRVDLNKYDTSKSGKLDKKTFTKAMNNLPVTVNDETLDQLFAAGESPDYRGLLDVKLFLDKVSQAAKYNPSSVP